MSSILSTSQTAEKRLVETSRFFTGISVHFRYPPSEHGTGQIWLHFLPNGEKIMELPPSIWRQADVHRTSAFNGSNLLVLFLQKEIAHRLVCYFFLEVPARFELANESFADSCLTTWPRYHMK